MFAYPDHPCVVYLPTFTKESNHMHVNIPCMDGMGYVCSCFFFTSISFSFFTSPLPIFFWPKRFAYSQFSILNQNKTPNLIMINQFSISATHFVAMVGRSGHVRRFKPALFATIFVLPLLHLAMSFSLTFVGAMSWKIRNRQQIRVRAEPDTTTEAWKEPGLFWGEGEGVVRYCWWFRNPVGSSSHYFQDRLHPSSLFGFLPSTVWIKIVGFSLGWGGCAGPSFSLLSGERISRY